MHQCSPERRIRIAYQVVMQLEFEEGKTQSVYTKPSTIISTLVDLMKSCVLLMKLPGTEGESWRIGEAVRAKGDSLFLLGDAVAICRREYRGHASSIASGALSKDAKVCASARDLRARGIEASELLEGIKIVEDIEGDFIDVMMDQAERVVAW